MHPHELHAAAHVRPANVATHLHISLFNKKMAGQ